MQVAVASGALVEVGAALLDEGALPIPTYRTKSAATCIDRVLCTPHTLGMVKKLTVCSEAGTGSHLPIILSLDRADNRLPPLLKTVHEIPVSKDPLDPRRVVPWQLEHTEDFAAFREALENQDVELAHFKWATIWEGFLQTVADAPQNWMQYTGRATAKEQFARPLLLRQATQIQSDFERELWHFLGVLQGHRQGRFVVGTRVTFKGDRLYTHISKRRALPPLDWTDEQKCAELEAAVRAAIKAERGISIAVRMRAWKSSLNVGAGMNAMARKMVRGPPPRLQLLRADGADHTCPLAQSAALDAAWNGLDARNPDAPMIGTIWENVRHSHCELPRITAKDITEQLRRTKSSTSCGPDWWRVKELKAIPEAGLSMLAALFNMFEDCGRMPAAMMGGWLRPIPKEGFTSTPLAVRPISVLSLLHRTWSGIRFQHMQAWASQILRPCQSAFRPGRSTKREIHTLLFQMNRCLAAKIPIYVGQLDLSKAFARMNRCKAVAIARASGLTDRFVKFLEQACLGKNMKWKISGSVSPASQQRRGTPQGCALSILLFQVLMAPVVRELADLIAARCHLSRVLVYADDIIFMCTTPELLSECMARAADLLTSLDFVVNVCKSSVATTGALRVPTIIVADQQVPIREHPDIFGSTLTTRSARLAAPDALPETSPSRTVMRWVK
eukprot:4421891-Amphidinium_carterae.1